MTDSQTIRHIALDMAFRFQGKGQAVDAVIDNARKLETFIVGSDGLSVPALPVQEHAV